MVLSSSTTITLITIHLRHLYSYDMNILLDINKMFVSYMTYDIDMFLMNVNVSSSTMILNFKEFRGLIPIFALIYLRLEHSYINENMGQSSHHRNCSTFHWNDYGWKCHDDKAIPIRRCGLGCILFWSHFDHGIDHSCSKEII